MLGLVFKDFRVGLLPVQRFGSESHSSADPNMLVLSLVAEDTRGSTFRLPILAVTEIIVAMIAHTCTLLAST